MVTVLKTNDDAYFSGTTFSKIKMMVMLLRLYILH